MMIGLDATPGGRTETPLFHPAYRPDIDGLRAVAVLSVVGFHGVPSAVPGGFTGVDIFFVISGFLISSIIFGGLQNNAFSFAMFYVRRMRRIFPALIVVLFASFAIGWVYLFADEYRQLGKHIAAGAGFISNFVLLNEAGYFDNAAETKPLLHLWSLGVEEQFYIAWPVLIWLVWRLRLNAVAFMIVAAVFSFALNIVWTADQPAAAFFSPFTRFWELLTGSLLALAAVSKWSVQDIVRRSPDRPRDFIAAMTAQTHLSLEDLLSLWGAALIMIGLVAIDRSSSFPGWWALLPVLGAAMIIAAGPVAWVNRTLLSKPIMVWVGLISYPLYLWHWPLLSFANILGGGTVSLAQRLAIILASLVLAHLTYRFVEQPIRKSASLNWRFARVPGAIVAAGIAGVAVFVNDGISARGPAAAILKTGNDDGDLGFVVNECIANEQTAALFENCVRDRREEPRFALLGDSKALAIFPALVRTSIAGGRWLFIGGPLSKRAGFVAAGNTALARAQSFADLAIDAVTGNSGVSAVVIAHSTRGLFRLKNDSSIEDLPESPHYGTAFDELSAAIDELLRHGKKVVLLVDNPTLLAPKNCVVRNIAASAADDLNYDNGKCAMGLPRHLELSAQYRKLLFELERRYASDVVVFDTVKYLCDEERQICSPFKNGRMLYSYADHISDYAAGLIAQDLNRLLVERK